MDAGAKTILVVDDQEGVRQLLFEILHTEGFYVATAADGQEALEMMVSLSPAILIIDMKMPGMSGLDVLKELQKKGSNCLSIMMTAYGELEIVKEALQLGVTHFINKPFDIDEFRQVIQKALQEL